MDRLARIGCAAEIVRCANINTHGAWGAEDEVWMHLRFRRIAPHGRVGLANGLHRGVVEHGSHQLGFLG